ncbi:WD repeat-containing protein 89 [Microplitis mediator]|uniref:WD repeat-containing protein 89 n=1 Tax=Microplitis mediator TaxID=375433 RepID=UPI00255633EA|nr:WD repeat-containing protein 89 [Microplitis mediator]
MPKIIENSRKKEGDNTGALENSISSKSINRCEMILSMEDAVSTEDNYILGICGTQSEPEFRICAALSDYTCVVYNVGEQLSKMITLDHNTSPIVGAKFCHGSKNILYTATKHGSISACDLRAKGKTVAELKDNSSEGKLKPLASFDISCDDRLVAAGTEHIGGDAFILFWDIRYNNSKFDSRNNLLGGYWESHMDDVTSLAFHSVKEDVLASGSTDGLINVFDLTQTTEDSALNHSLNTESSVDRVGWLDDGNLWCTTHTHSLQMWRCEDASPFVKYDRSCIANFLNEDPDVCYLVNMHKADSIENPFLLTGLSSIKGENFSGLMVNDDGLEVCYDFIGNKQIVRDSWLHTKSGCLVTGGESSILNVWKPSPESLLIQRHSDRKSVAKSNGKARDKHRTKPY